MRVVHFNWLRFLYFTRCTVRNSANLSYSEGRTYFLFLLLDLQHASCAMLTRSPNKIKIGADNSYSNVLPPVPPSYCLYAIKISTLFILFGRSVWKSNVYFKPMVTLSLLDQLTKVDDRFDIEESFDALDVHHTGRLGFDRGKASFVF